MENDPITTLTAEEKKLAVELLERVKDELPQSFFTKSDQDQDLFLVRWLRARDLDLDAATTMLQNSLKWRKEKLADEALATMKISPFYMDNFPYTFAGADKKGHPVILLPLAFWDFRKIVNNASVLEEFDDFVTHFFETLMAKVDDEHKRRREIGGEPITQVMFLIDVKNYPYGQLMSYSAIKKLLQVASTYEAHYPEILYKAIFINCPSYFNIFINILKPVLAPRTLGKLTCYSQIKDWEREMLQYVDPSSIPKQYGGTAGE